MYGGIQKKAKSVDVIICKCLLAGAHHHSLKLQTPSPTTEIYAMIMLSPCSPCVLSEVCSGGGSSGGSKCKRSWLEPCSQAPPPK